MDLKTVGIILERFAPLSMIADKNGDILWKSTSVEGLVSSEIKKITEILGVNEDELRKTSDNARIRPTKTDVF